jgi:C4-dicarboxylate-specific signal transduction histidine kinase
MQGYRLAYRRELQDRRRAESAVKRLNTRLEQRVAERTAALEMTNQMLAEEVAERRRTANALRVSQAQLADIVDNSTALVSLKDHRGRYLLVNREFEHRVRRSRAEVVGKTDRELFPAPLVSGLSTGDDAVLAGGAPLSFEQDLSFADAPRSYVCVKFPLHGVSGAVYGVGSMCTDITPMKQLQEEVRRHQDELAHVLRVQTMGEMTAALAHEINQPLGAITTYAQGAVQRLRNGAADPAALLHVCEEIAREGLRAAQVIRAMRNLVARESRPNAALDINALAAEAARVLEPQARRHGVTVRVEAAAEMPPVQGDGTQIEQVMLNLMLNGVEAIASAAGRQREIVVATGFGNYAIEVAVSDTGAGIAPTVADKLFTPFFTTKPHGLGLGLAISRSIIESHGGRLWASANPPAGSTFHFSLPIPPPAPLRRPDPA